MFKKFILVLLLVLSVSTCHGAADLSWSGIAVDTTADPEPLDTIIDSIISYMNDSGIDSTSIENGAIANIDINSSAGIVDTKLASTFSVARTFSNNNTMDDGATHSPAWRYLGGSNDDLATMQLLNDTTQYYSDFAITLPGNDSNSEFNLWDKDGVKIVAFDADGALQIDSNLTIGSGAAGVDNTITIAGETNSWLATWMEDEDYLKTLDDLLIGETAELYLYDKGGESILGDGTDLTIKSGALVNLTATSDVVLPVNIGLILDGVGAEKIESDGTDITITVGATGDINVAANIGITLGDDGERFEGDGTDLHIYSSNLLNLTATTDVVIPVNKGLIFGDGAEKIESNNTDFTINSGNHLNLTTVGNVVPSNHIHMVQAKSIYFDSTDTGITSSIDADEDLDLIADDDIEMTPDDDVDMVLIGNGGECHISRSDTNDASALRITQGSTGDAAIEITSDGNTYAIGVYSTDDSFRISDNATLGTNDRLVIDSGGMITLSGTTVEVGAALITGTPSLFGARDASFFVLDAAAKQATTDGLLTVFSTSNSLAWHVDSDSANPPTIEVARHLATAAVDTVKATITVPILKGDYVEVIQDIGSGGITIHWVPIGADN